MMTKKVVKVRSDDLKDIITGMKGAFLDIITQRFKLDGLTDDQLTEMQNNLGSFVRQIISMNAQITGGDVGDLPNMDLNSVVEKIAELRFEVARPVLELLAENTSKVKESPAFVKWMVDHTKKFIQ